MGEKEASSLEPSLTRSLQILAVKLRKLGLRSLIVFGSRARGEALRESDVDLLVIAEGFEGKPFYEREYLVLREWSGSWPLEPWCYTPQEALRGVLEKPRIDLVDAVENGIVVYDDGFWRSLREKYLVKHKPYTVERSREGWPRIRLKD